jgi:hypothetical protein
MRPTRRIPSAEVAMADAERADEVLLDATFELPEDE